MKLIQEANADDKFRSVMDKLQRAIADMEKISKDEAFRPVVSQVNQVLNAIDMLSDIKSDLNIKRHGK